MVFLFRNIVWMCSKVAWELSWHLLSSSFGDCVWTLTVVIFNWMPPFSKSFDLISQVSRNPARWKGSSWDAHGMWSPRTATPVHSGSDSHVYPQSWQVKDTSDERIGRQIASCHFFLEPSASGILEFRPVYFASWGCWTERGIQYWKAPSNVNVMQYFKIEWHSRLGMSKAPPIGGILGWSELSFLVFCILLHLSRLWFPLVHMHYMGLVKTIGCSMKLGLECQMYICFKAVRELRQKC